MFHLVSLSLQISLTDLPGPCLGLCVGVVVLLFLGGFVVGFFLLGKFDLNHMLIPVVDRPCLALVRQCRKKKRITSPSLSTLRTIAMAPTLSPFPRNISLRPLLSSNQQCGVLLEEMAV